MRLSGGQWQPELWRSFKREKLKEFAFMLNLICESLETIHFLSELL